MLDVARIKAIGLDLDDTLWPVAPTIQRAEAALQDWLARHAPGAARAMSDLPQRMALRKRVVALAPHIAHDMSALRRAVIAAALDEAGEAVDLAEPAFQVFFEHRNRVELYDDALAALEFLAARFPVVAVSNGNADVQRVGLGRHFHAAVGAHTAGVAKPDARIFAAAAQAAGVAPHEMLHVGDDTDMDVLGALDAGQQAVWLNRHGRNWPHARQPHATVADLHALCRRLA